MPVGHALGGGRVGSADDRVVEGGAERMLDVHEGHDTVDIAGDGRRDSVAEPVARLLVERQSPAKFDDDSLFLYPYVPSRIPREPHYY